MNDDEYQLSLFDSLTDPLRPDEVPLAAYSDMELAYIVAAWKYDIDSA